MSVAEYEAMEQRHEEELKLLEEEVRNQIKAAKKSEKNVVEAQGIQKIYDLKAQHRDERDELEEKLIQNGKSLEDIEEEIIKNKKLNDELENKKNEEKKNKEKKEKKDKKKEKKEQKEKEKEIEKQNRIKELKENPIQNLKENEEKLLKSKLSSSSLYYLDMPSDGSCLYHSLASQLNYIKEKKDKKYNEEEKKNGNHHVETTLVLQYLSNYTSSTTTTTTNSSPSTPSSSSSPSSIQTYSNTLLRYLISQYLLDNFSSYFYFLDFNKEQKQNIIKKYQLKEDDEEQINKKLYEEYCLNIKNSSEWGGEMELTAFSELFQREVLVFSTSFNTLSFKPQKNSLIDEIPARLSYHKHYYHLGEHYNSVVEFD